MIKPVGSKELKPLFIYDPEIHESLAYEAESLPSVILSSQAAGNAVMMGAGYFSPLEGFMTVNDAISCAENMYMSNGTFFPIPILCLLEDSEAIRNKDRIALRDPNIQGNPIMGIMNISNIERINEEQIEIISQKIYGTNTLKHPGVAAFKSQGKIAISGPIQVLNFSYFQTDFPDTFRTAVEIRNEIQERGWKTIVAFQTRNPMHRAHEELCKMAMDEVGADGVCIHMLLGKLKPGDIPAPVRDAAIRKMAELYFPTNSVMVTGYGFDMLYAGPREAVLHAYFRQNMGATHFIIGRDHAGVGDYYGDFEAQTIFSTRVPKDVMEIDIFRADHTAYSKKLNRVVMMRDVPDHKKDDFIILSGTKVREMLSQGIAPPAEFSRPEVAKILMDYYQSL